MKASLSFFGVPQIEHVAAAMLRPDQRHVGASARRLKRKLHGETLLRAERPVGAILRNLRVSP